MRRTIIAMLALASSTLAFPALAQPAPQVVVSIYRGAPGQQMALLKWMAQQDQVARAAGVAPGQLYVHQDGASWDFLVISPATTPQQDAAVEAAAKKMGVAGGPMAGVELRRYIAEHSDTFAAGPTTAADWLRSLGQ